MAVQCSTESPWSPPCSASCHEVSCHEGSCSLCCSSWRLWQRQLRRTWPRGRLRGRMCHPSERLRTSRRRCAGVATVDKKRAEKLAQRRARSATHGRPLSLALDSVRLMHPSTAVVTCASVGSSKSRPSRAERFPLLCQHLTRPLSEIA